MEDKSIIRLWLVILGSIIVFVAMCFGYSVFSKTYYFGHTTQQQRMVDRCVYDSNTSQSDTSSKAANAQWCYSNIK